MKFAQQIDQPEFTRRFAPPQSGYHGVMPRISRIGRAPNSEHIKKIEEDINMPTISMFYGIIIYMYYFDNKEHKTPHIHANYAEYDVVISIPKGDVLNGEMANNKLKLIKAWVEIHQEDLMADWKLAVEGQQPHKIEPLR